MTKRQFWDLAYLRACSLPINGFLSSDLASSTTKGKPAWSSSRKSINPLLDTSKFSPSASMAALVSLTLGSRTMLALHVAWSKNRQPDSSSSLLILMRAWASLAATCAPLFIWGRCYHEAILSGQNHDCENLGMAPASRQKREFNARASRHLGGWIRLL